jgi:hypothetical protein
MRRQRGLVKLTGLAALVGLGMIAKPAVATTTTEQSASILVFPKVIADGTRDTLIQITNTSNNMVHAHCFYVNGAPAPPPARGPWCLETDFDIWLTKQQPTTWAVSLGRKAVDINGIPTGGEWGVVLPGIPPATLIPPVAPDFTGELKCIQVDSSGAPLSGNALKGEATIVGDILGAGEETAYDKSKYNAIGLKGFNTNDQDTVLCLGSSSASNDSCPNGREYEACPQGWFIDHPATMAIPDPSYGYTSSNLTVVPCTENFETQSPTSVTLQFLVTNEYEQTLSTSTTLTCWASWDLGSDESDSFLRTFNIGVIGGTQLQTRLRTANASKSGVIPVIEEYAGVAYPNRAVADRNAHQTPQDQTGMDIITFPADQGAVQ